jgi:hypothetical protein
VAQRKHIALGIGVIAASSLALAVRPAQSPPGKARSLPPAHQDYDAEIQRNAARMLEEGKRTFRFNTFGSEDFWGGKLRLHEALAGEKLGGVGKGVSPKAALGLGLKVDAEALPAELVGQIKAGKVDLDDPATTAALLKLNAVVGVTGFFTHSRRQTPIHRHPVRAVSLDGR